MLTFDEATHQYHIDGIPVPSVTQLVAPLGDALDDLDPDLELTMEAAAERGVTMHAYLAHRLLGNAPEDFELPVDYQPYAEAVEQFLLEHRITPLLIETALAGDGFAGTPDLVCEFDGPLAILDYKFVSQVAKSKVGAQLGGQFLRVLAVAVPYHEKLILEIYLVHVFQIGVSLDIGAAVGSQYGDP